FWLVVFGVGWGGEGGWAGVAGAALFLISFVLLGPAQAPTGLWSPPASSGVAYLADPIVFEFVFGMIIALAYQAGVRLSIWNTIGSIAVGCIWFAATIDSLPRPYSAGITAALIVAGMSLSSLPSPQSRVIRGVPFLGAMSYALYLTHLLSFSLVAWIVAKLAISPAGHAWTYFAATLATGLLIAAATYLIVEKPTTKFLKRWIERPRLPVTRAMPKY